MSISDLLNPQMFHNKHRPADQNRREMLKEQGKDPDQLDFAKIPELHKAMFAGRGPYTFGGKDLSERMNPDGTATDGSLVLWVSAMARMARFQYMTSSLEGLAVDAFLSLCTTRTWTYNIQSGKEYALAISDWLKLDWLGAKPGGGSMVPGLAGPTTQLAFTNHKKRPGYTSGD